MISNEPALLLCSIKHQTRCLLLVGVKTEISRGIAVLLPAAVSGNNLKPSVSKIPFAWSETGNLTN